MSAEIVDRIIDAYSRLGHLTYGEELTEIEHALQCAYFARRGGEPAHMVAACLLHDVGHLLHGLGEDAAILGVDGRHEDVGADFLSIYFKEEVFQPVRLHVQAKRYWCWRHPGYFERLSNASRRSLELQGGVMAASEAEDFKRNRFGDAAVWLRRYDDAAKVAGLQVPPIEEYRSLLTSLLHK